MTNRVADLALHCGQQWPVAMAMTPSDAQALYESDTFKGWQKWREGQQNLLVAMVNGQNAIIKGLQAIAKGR